MRLNTWSAMKSAAAGATLAGRFIGRPASVSTGEPKATMLARSFDRRKAAVW